MLPPATVLLAPLLLAAALTGGQALAQAAAPAAAASAPTLRAETAKPLSAAQEAIKAGKLHPFTGPLNTTASGGPQTSTIHIDNKAPISDYRIIFTINPATRSCRRAGEPIDLTAKEFALLELLLQELLLLLLLLLLLQLSCGRSLLLLSRLLPATRTRRHRRAVLRRARDRKSVV